MYVREGLGQVQIPEWKCPKLNRMKVGNVTVWSLPATFFFKSGLAIDADGAPNAYHPTDKGSLDFLVNAGYPPKKGKTPWGIVLNNKGKPIIQEKSDPFPGFMVSTTSLGDNTRPVKDPRRYVDSTQIPYIALPKAPADRLGTKLGDFAAVINGNNRRLSFAIFADIGHIGRRGEFGEGSIALAQSLGHNPFDAKGKARNGIRGDVIYVVFPGSGNGKPQAIAEINSNGARLFKEWGGMTQIDACFFPTLPRDYPVPSVSERYA